MWKVLFFSTLFLAVYGQRLRNVLQPAQPLAPPSPADIPLEPRSAPLARARPGYAPGDESPKPYNFEYVAPAVDDKGSGSSTRTESADGTGRVVGSYTITDYDGRTRTVEYVADETGFHATVQTNEPGTRSDSPADVQFHSSAIDPFLEGGNRSPIRVRRAYF